MAKAEAMIEKKRNTVIQKSKICNYGRARYLFENALAGQKGYTLTRDFQSSVKYQLPARYDQRAYMKFIEQWGTV